MIDPHTILSALTSPSNKAGLNGPHRRILVVEDDVDLCMLIRQVIQEMEETVHVQFASTVHEATMWLDGPKRFDLVLADFLLADSRSGYELRAICQDRAPNTLFVMMSAMPLQLPELSDSDFLQKPFTGAQCGDFIGKAFKNTPPCQEGPSA